MTDSNLKEKIERFRRFQESYRNGEGDVIYGLKAMDNMKFEIVDIYNGLAKQVEVLGG